MSTIELVARGLMALVGLIGCFAALEMNSRAQKLYYQGFRKEAWKKLLWVWLGGAASSILILMAFYVR